MSSNLKEILGLIERLETTFDEYQQSLQKDKEGMLQNLSQTWKKMKTEQLEIEKLEQNLNAQHSELTELIMRSEELDKQLSGLNSIKQENLLKIDELSSNLEKASVELKAPTNELESFQSKIKTLDEKLSTKESEKIVFDQKMIDNENRERQLKILYTEDKMEELNRKLALLKKNNYFTSFLIENSEEEIPEVDIISTIMNQGSCNLEELKKLLDVPPIMAVRTIKQLAVKGIINLDDNTNIISLP
jgi:chromosome segregation ATPase